MFRNTFCMIIVFVAFSGCGSEPRVVEDAANLNVDFDWTEKSRCSTVSPPITVANVPQQTRYLKVTIKDLDMPSYNHGGGEFPYNGSSIIREAAISSYYRGPPPPYGVVHSYELTVQALGPDRKLVLGQGKKVNRYPPER